MATTTQDEAARGAKALHSPPSTQHSSSPSQPRPTKMRCLSLTRRTKKRRSPEPQNRLSVLQKLRKAVSDSPTIGGEYQMQLPLADDNRPFQPHFRPSTVGGLQRSIDALVGLDQNQPSFMAPDIAMKDADMDDINGDAPPTHQTYHAWMKERDDRLEAMQSIVTSASMRLHVVTGCPSRHAYAPYANNIQYWPLKMNVESDAAETPEERMQEVQSSTEMHANFDRACRQHGFKRIVLDSCVFKKRHQTKSDDRPSKGKEPEGTDTEVIMDIDSEAGSIIYYESHMLNAHGVLEKWMWIKFTKPIAYARRDLRRSGEVLPDGFYQFQDSWVMFGIPTHHVMVLHHEWGPNLPYYDAYDPEVETENGLPTPFKPWTTQLPRDRLPKATLLFSKDAVPKFACSAKAPGYSKKGFPPDFLSCGEVYQLPSAASPEARWRELRDMAVGDRERWAQIQDAMAEFACEVDVRPQPGANWEWFSPSEDTDMWIDE